MCALGDRGAIATPKSTMTIHPKSEIINADFVDSLSANHPKAKAPGEATNWMMTIVAILNASAILNVSAANAPAIATTGPEVHR